ncbi:putative MFS monosaccharide transporter [Exophiala viscosa]|uniref:MFS monosaccharide transporter n=1 Tax=Exophiala viscosa TaxID=2486360 RepID=A0AAN6E3L7_9EURO|nr:putative MFS monosaccharide transporter [Exophiala viscosa]
MNVDRYTLGVALFASLGTFLYGYDTGIVTTTIAHPSWVAYMNHPDPALVGAVGAIYIGGEAVGALLQIAIGDKLGRLRYMELLCVIVTIECCIQTAAVNIGMLLTGRILTGIAVGSLCATVPVYLSEISDPRHRGFIGGLSGVNLSCGIMVSNWIGFACNYAPYGQLQWRLPLALQIPWAVIMFIGLVTFMPNSPRHLLRQGKVEEARGTFIRVRRDLQSHEVQQEFALMKSQMAFEQEQRSPSFMSAFQRYRRRVLVSISVQVLTAITGVNVIQYYQTTLYKSLGIQSKTVLALTAVWGTCAFLSSALSIPFLPDRMGRRNMLLAGTAWVILTEIYAAVMQREFQDTNNRVGKGFAILGIYVFTVGYYALINPVTWLYGAEVLPVALRNKFMGVAAFCHYAVNVSITEAGPSAFLHVRENYYYVFVGCCAVYLFIIYFFYPETKQKTLEEVAAAFGDEVVEVEVHQDALTKEAVIETKVADAAHIEDKP